MPRKNICLTWRPASCGCTPRIGPLAGHWSRCTWKWKRRHRSGRCAIWSGCPVWCGRARWQLSRQWLGRKWAGAGQCAADKWIRWVDALFWVGGGWLRRRRRGLERSGTFSRWCLGSVLTLMSHSWLVCLSLELTTSVGGFCPWCAIRPCLVGFKARVIFKTVKQADTSKPICSMKSGKETNKAETSYFQFCIERIFCLLFNIFAFKTITRFGFKNGINSNLRSLFEFFIWGANFRPFRKEKPKN